MYHETEASPTGQDAIVAMQEVSSSDCVSGYYVLLSQRVRSFSSGSAACAENNVLSLCIVQIRRDVFTCSEEILFCCCCVKVRQHAQEHAFGTIADCVAEPQGRPALGIFCTTQLTSDGHTLEAQLRHVAAPIKRSTFLADQGCLMLAEESDQLYAFASIN